MNYIGSKKSLLEFIEESIAKVVSEKDYKFSDLFAEIVLYLMIYNIIVLLSIKII